jgi:hypothetical protein
MRCYETWNKNVKINDQLEGNTSDFAITRALNSGEDEEYFENISYKKKK